MFMGSSWAFYCLFFNGLHSFTIFFPSDILFWSLFLTLSPGIVDSQVGTSVVHPDF